MATTFNSHSVEDPHEMTLTRRGDYDTMVEVLCAGLDPNKSYKGQTLLMHAAELGHDRLLSLLIENGAHVDTQDRYGRTALFMAARFGHLESCKVLCAAGARDDFRAELLGGEDALQAARARGHLHISKFLQYEQHTVRGSPAPKVAPAAVSPVKGVDVNKNYHKINPEAEIEYGTRSIAAGGATGATYAGRYTEKVDAPPQPKTYEPYVPTPLPPPVTAAAQPIRDETRRLAPPPKYTI